MAISFGKIANALKSEATDHILGVAQDIYDETVGQYQSEINESHSETLSAHTDTLSAHTDTLSAHTSNFNNYLPLTGGTLSGSLNMTQSSRVFGSGTTTDFWLMPSTHNFWINAEANKSRLAYWRIAPEYAKDSNEARQPEQNTLYFQARYRDFSNSTDSGYTSRLALHYQHTTPPEGSEEAEDDPKNTYNRITAIGGFANRLFHNQSFEIYDVHSSTPLFSINSKKINGDWGILTKFNTQVNIGDGFGLTIGENEFTKDGLKYPLTIKYRDSQNVLKEVSYRGSKNTTSNPNTIDLSNGVYYATTSKTASRLANSLIVKDSVGNIVTEYNGSVPNTELILPGITEISYEDLKQLRDESRLSIGEKYRIIDYVTTTVGGRPGESSVSAGHAFDIIVEALDTNILSENVSVCEAKYVNKDSEIPDTPSNGEWYSYVDVAPGDWVAPVTSELVADMAAVLDFEPTTDTIRKVCITEYNSNGDSPWKITCKAGSLCVKFKWVRNSGHKRINICGVTLKSAATNQIVSRDYHYGFAGNPENNNKYVLQVPTDGDYYIDCFIIKHQNYDGGVIDSTVTIGAYPVTDGGYFSNCKLTSWDVKYSLDNDSSRFRWAKSDGKGVIYYLKDEYNNQAGFDFKNIMFNNKYVFNYRINDVDYDGSVLYGRYCHDNTIGVDLTDTSTGSLMGLTNINFKNTSTSAECHSNIIHKNCWSIQFGNGCNKNVINAESESITFGNDCIGNILGSGCKENEFGYDCKYNVLNEGCLKNTFEPQCISNILYNDCNSNTFETQCCDNKLGRLSNNNTFRAGCYSNTFGSNCSNNKFETNISVSPPKVCYSNTFGDNCYSNTFGAGCHSNEFGASCYSNTFGTDCYSNSFGSLFISNTCGTNCHSNTFGNNCKNNVLTSFCYSNNFGSFCWTNKLGNGVFANTFGIDCSNIEIITAANSTTLLQFVRNFKFGNYCSKLKIYPKVSVTTADTASKYLQNFEFGNNLGNTSQYTNIALEGTATNLLGRTYITKIDKNSSGTIIQKCLMDASTVSYSNGKLTISII